MSQKKGKRKVLYTNNGTKNIRFTSSFPEECLDYLNEHNCRNSDFLELLRLGIEAKKQQEGKAVDISYLLVDMSKEEMEKINQNHILKQKFVELARWFLFSKETIPFQTSTIQVKREPLEIEESLRKDDEVDVSEGSLLDRTMQLLDDDE